MLSSERGRSALLLGATGLIGSHCLVHLLAGDTYARVTCFVRRAGLKPHERLEERVIDFDALLSSPSANASAETPKIDLDLDVDDVYCAIGSTMKKAGSQSAFRRVDYDLPLAIAKLARPRAKRMALVSSVGADSKAGNFYLKTKGELEDALATSFSSKGDELHVFRPSFLVGDRQESRPGEAVSIALVRGVSGLLLGGLRKYKPIHVERVARAMVAAMTRPLVKEEEQAVPVKRVYEHDAIEALAERL